MNKAYFLFSTVAIFAFHSYGQSNTKTYKIENDTAEKNKLAGTWRLIEFTDLDAASGKWTYPYGKNPRGFFTYTKNNIVNLNISSETPLHISEDSAKKYSIKLDDYIWHYALGYFGTYSIDFKNSIVTHHVAGGSIPYYIDTDQPRPFTLKGDTLIISDNKSWKRVLVRAD
jgi:hypothetical protein